MTKSKLRLYSFKISNIKYLGITVLLPPLFFSSDSNSCTFTHPSPNQLELPAGDGITVLSLTMMGQQHNLCINPKVAVKKE